MLVLLGWFAPPITIVFMLLFVGGINNAVSLVTFVLICFGGVIPLIPIIVFHMIIVQQIQSCSKETFTYSILACFGGILVGVRFTIIPYELLFRGFFSKYEFPFEVNFHIINQYHVAYIFFVVGSLFGYLIIYLSLVLLRKNLALIVSGIILCVTALLALRSLIPYASPGSFSIGILGYYPLFYLAAAFGLGNIMVGLGQIFLTIFWKKAAATESNR